MEMALPRHRELKEEDGLGRPKKKRKNQEDKKSACSRKFTPRGIVRSDREEKTRCGTRGRRVAKQLKRYVLSILCIRCSIFHVEVGLVCFVHSVPVFLIG